MWTHPSTVHHTPVAPTTRHSSVGCKRPDERRLSCKSLQKSGRVAALMILNVHRGDAFTFHIDLHKTSRWTVCVCVLGINRCWLEATQHSANLKRLFPSCPFTHTHTVQTTNDQNVHLLKLIKMDWLNVFRPTFPWQKISVSSVCTSVD